MEKAEYNRNRANLVAYISQPESNVHLVDLIIENTGNSFAKGISIQNCGYDFNLFGDKKFSGLDVMKFGIKSFPARYKLCIPMLSMIGRAEELKNKDVKLMISYKDGISDKNYNEEFVLDFNCLRQFQVGKTAMVEIAENCGNIVKRLDEIRRVIHK